jgi:hypothetical protein
MMPGPAKASAEAINPRRSRLEHKLIWHWGAPVESLEVYCAILSGFGQVMTNRTSLARLQFGGASMKLSFSEMSFDRDVRISGLIGVILEPFFFFIISPITIDNLR